MTAIVLDWDGTLHEHAHYTSRFGRVNLALIAQAHARGYPVAISTCNDVWRISEYLRDHGYATLTDHNREYGQCGWDGGRGGHVILVTNLKVSGYLIDDRAFNYHYGDGTLPVWEQVQDAEEAKADPYAKAPGSIERSRHDVVDNVTGEAVHTGLSLPHANFLCRGLNIQAGPGGRYSVKPAAHGASPTSCAGRYSECSHNA